MSRTTAIVLLVAVFVLAAVLVAGLILAIDKASEQPQAKPTGSQPSTDPAPVVVARPATGARIGPQKFRPTSKTTSLQVLDYRFFVVGYDNDRRNPAWVSYDLDGPITHPGPEAKRPAQFATETRTSAKVTHKDYTNSGYDRGHMCPAYAMFSRYGEEGERATFVCTNIIPQPHALNAGWWEDLEEHIAGRDGRSRGWADTLGHLTIINGPVYHGEPRRLSSGVAIPDACFAIALDYLEDTGGYRALAFEIPDLPTATGTLEQYLVPIKRIEADAGLDVFDGVDPAIRAELEEATAGKAWP